MPAGPGPGPTTVSSGRALPFEAETLSGRTVRFPDDYKGKLVLLDFWATWCTPCLQEMPKVAAAREQYGGRGFEVLGLVLDDGSSAAVRRVVEQRNLTWDQVHKDARRIATAYGVTAIPAMFLVDGDTGAVVAHGDEIRGAALATAIEKNLKGVQEARTTTNLGP